MVNVEDASCSIMMVIPTKKWDDIIYPGLTPFKTSSKADLHYNHNAEIIRLGENILAAASESSIDENYYLIDNQSICNAFINGKYLSNIIDSPDWKYIRVHFNTGVTHNKNIGELT